MPTLYLFTSFLVLLVFGVFLYSCVSLERSTYNVLITSSLFWDDLGHREYIKELSSLRSSFEPSSQDGYELKSMRSPRYFSPSLILLTISTADISQAIARIEEKLRLVGRLRSGMSSTMALGGRRSGKAKILEVEKLAPPKPSVGMLWALIFIGVFYVILFIVPLISPKVLWAVVMLISIVVAFQASRLSVTFLPRLERVVVRTPAEIWDARTEGFVHSEEISYYLLQKSFENGDVVSVAPELETRELRAVVRLTGSGRFDSLLSEIKDRVAHFLAISGVRGESIRDFESSKGSVVRAGRFGDSFERQFARARLTLIVIASSSVLFSVCIYLRSMAKR